MGFTLDFTHGPDAFFDSVTSIPGDIIDDITDGIDDVVDTLGDLMKKMAMPLMIIGGGLLVFMLIKK
jgi:hypothetical protein